MKLNCNSEESKQVCQIINEFDTHRENYIKVFNVELTKGKVSNRIHVGAPLRQVEVNCFKVRHSSEFAYNKVSTGTRYIYEGEILYTEIYKWYNKHLRDNKLEELFNGFL